MTCILGFCRSGPGNLPDDCLETEEPNRDMRSRAYDDDQEERTMYWDTLHGALCSSPNHIPVPLSPKAHHPVCVLRDAPKLIIVDHRNRRKLRA